MENKIDSIIQKLYDEGVERAKGQATELVDKAEKDAEQIVANANEEAKRILEAAQVEIENLKRKADSEMKLSARQALTALRQDITNLVASDVAGNLAKATFSDKDFVQKLLLTVIQKWDATAGSLNLQVLMSEEEKSAFEAYVASNYKELLDKGLTVKAANIESGFVVEPKDGGYRIAFSEELFNSFFDQYVKSFSKKLLFDQQA